MTIFHVRCVLCRRLRPYVPYVSKKEQIEQRLCWRCRGEHLDCPIDQISEPVHKFWWPWFAMTLPFRIMEGMVFDLCNRARMKAEFPDYEMSEEPSASSFTSMVKRQK